MKFISNSGICAKGAVNFNEHVCTLLIMTNLYLNCK